MDVKRAIREYWDSRAREYDRSPGHTILPEVWREVLRKTFPSKMKILDVGTGTGFIALLLAELGHEVTGIDISTGMLEVAKRKAAEMGVEVEFRIGDAEDLPFDDETFDAVVSRHLLWTLTDPRKAVEEWKRVVKRGGKVVAFDGVWMDPSLASKVKRGIARIAIAIYERRNPLRRIHYGRKISRALPFYGGMDPSKVVELFEFAGLEDVRVRDLTWIRRLALDGEPAFYRLALEDRRYFMVEGYRR